jgi:DNA-binding response OmpR family regulator
MPQSEKKRIVIVENDPDMLFMLGKALKDAGYSVQKYQAASLIVENKNQLPDLFILDKDLPMIDGLAVCKFLKVHDETKGIPVIMISAYPIKAKAKHAGVNEFISKPFELNHLLRTINKYLN